MKMIELGQDHIYIEHRGEILCLGGILESEYFHAMIHWIKRFPSIQEAKEYSKARGKFIYEETTRIYGTENFVAHIDEISEMYPGEAALSEAEQIEIMHIIAEHWTDTQLPIYFIDKKYNPICKTKEEKKEDKPRRGFWKRSKK